jgi:hypothetical protein
MVHPRNQELDMPDALADIAGSRVKKTPSSLGQKSSFGRAGQIHAAASDRNVEQVGAQCCGHL